jgi:hypothetical protein
VGGVRLGTTDYPWGETACLSESELLRYEADDGTTVYGIDVGYSETNDGRVPAMGTWTNAMYLDGVQVITDAGHRDITTVNGIGGYQSFFAWSFEATNKVTLPQPDSTRHRLSLRLDAGNQLNEQDEENNYRFVDIVFKEHFPLGVCPQAPPTPPRYVVLIDTSQCDAA